MCLFQSNMANVALLSLWNLVIISANSRPCLAKCVHTDGRKIILETLSTSTNFQSFSILTSLVVQLHGGML